MDPRVWRCRLGVIMAIALVVRLVAAFRVERITGPDAGRYHGAALSLLEGHGFPATDSGPLYPGFIAAVYRFFGVHNGRSVQCAQAVGWSAAIGLIGAIGRQLFGSTVGLLSAAYAACYPPFIAYQGYAGSIYYATEGLFIWCLLLMVWRLIQGVPTHELNQKATRPLKVRLNCEKLQSLGAPPFRSLQEGLDETTCFRLRADL